MGQTVLIFSADGSRVDSIVVLSLYSPPLAFDPFPLSLYLRIESCSLCYLLINALLNSIDHIIPPHRSPQGTHFLQLRECEKELIRELAEPISDFDSHKGELGDEF